MIADVGFRHWGRCDECAIDAEHKIRQRLLFLARRSLNEGRSITIR
jgi:hypothetical protein